MASPSSSMLGLLSSFLFGSEFTAENGGNDETTTTMAQQNDNSSEESTSNVNPPEESKDESNMTDKMSRYIKGKKNKQSDTLTVAQCILDDVGLYLKGKLNFVNSDARNGFIYRDPLSHNTITFYPSTSTLHIQAPDTADGQQRSLKLNALKLDKRAKLNQK